jgi:GT2 family glycosyltransferase
MKISVCIATHERARLLESTLGHLAGQTKLPDETVISDSSAGEDSKHVAESFSRAGRGLVVKHLRSSRKALPWQRWWAFSNSSNDIVLFLDDDVKLARDAVARLVSVFERADGRPIAGAGFIMDLEVGGRGKRNRRSFREKWLGTAQHPSGALTPGGLSVSMAGLPEGQVAEVGWLWGGAMAYRREVLNSIGPLDELYFLYDKGIGKGEDCVLSHMASAHGRLLLITDKLAVHPDGGETISTANIHYGWRRGVRETLGRAHTMRWAAGDQKEFRRAWLRLASLELLRSTVGAVRAPLTLSRWQRLAGGVCGALQTLVMSKAIPDSPAAAGHAPRGDHDSALREVRHAGGGQS